MGITANTSEGVEMTVAADVRVSTRHQKDDGQRAEIQKVVETNHPCMSQNDTRRQQTQASIADCLGSRTLAKNRSYAAVAFYLGQYEQLLRYGKLATS